MTVLVPSQIGMDGTYGSRLEDMYLVQQPAEEGATVILFSATTALLLLFSFLDTSIIKPCHD